MGQLLKVGLLLLIILKLALSLQNSLLVNIVSDLVPFESNLPECLLRITRESNAYFTDNIGIQVEAESSHSRQEFMNIVGKFINLKNEAAIDLDSNGSDKYKIHGRIFLVDSLKSLDKAINRQRKLMDDVAAEWQYYLIIIPAKTPNLGKVLQKMFGLCWNASIINVNVLIEDQEGVITMYTYFPFTEQSCKNRKPVLYNRFVNGRFELSKTAFPAKLNNMWQCPVRLITPYPGEPYTILNGDQYSGLDVSVMGTVGAIMNFSLEAVQSFSDELNMMYSNVTLTGTYKKLNIGMGDFMVESCSQVGLSNFAMTTEFYAARKAVVFKRATTRVSLGLLLFPFDFYTWTVLLTIFAAKWVVVLIWERRRIYFTSFGDNSMRLCTVSWLFSILIVRSSYEGLIFKFMHNRPTEAPPDSLVNAVDQGYKFVVSNFMYEHLTYSSDLKHRLIPTGQSTSETFEIFDTLEGKYAFISFEDELKFEIDSTKTREHVVFYDFIPPYMDCVFFRQFSYLASEFNKRLQLMVTHGHVLKEMQVFWLKVQSSKREIVDEDVSSMSLNELYGAFQILVLLLSMSAGIFVVELLSKCSRRLKGFMDIFH